MKRVFDYLRTFLKSILYHYRSPFLAKANKIFNQIILKLGIEAETVLLLGGKYQCYRCFLKNKVNKEILATGIGTGKQEKAILKAKFEALENYTSLLGSLEKEQLNASMEQLSVQKKEIIESKIPIQIYLEEKYRKKILKWFKYKNIFNPKSELYSLAVLSSPLYLENLPDDDTFPYHQIYMQTSSNGLAIGSSFDKALIHAIEEVLERDAISFFLAETFLLTPINRIKIIDPKTLPRKVRKVYKNLISITGKFPIILKLNSCFELSVFCCCIYYDDLKISAKGLGASLDSTEAVYKALCECIEQVALYKERNSYELPNYFPNNPKLQACVRFNLNLFLEKNFFTLEKYECRNIAPIDLVEYKEKLLDMVKSKGFEVYYNILYTSDELSTVHVIIPDTEELLSITKGIMPRVGSRIKTILHRERSSHEIQVGQ